MQVTSTRVAASVALALGMLVSTNSGAVLPEMLETAPDFTTLAPPDLSNTPVTVVLQLAGNSIAEQQGAAGRKLDRAEKDGIKAQLRAQQEALRPSIESAGGVVLATFQSAYNGVKVQIARERLADLASLPGVVAVRPLQLHYPTNIHGVPFVGAPAVWQNLGLHGEGVKIAIIDTGIDYTHADFGGPGTAAAFDAAHAAETAPPDPALFGPAAPRIKGGIDLVGDSYNPSHSDPTLFQPVPHPDPNPLDCNGHGTHVAGTAAGAGVLSTGATYPGPYNATTISANSWNVGPGVAPKADLYAVRVFGCLGPSAVVLDGIDWAVDNDMDVINMSLAAAFGSADDPLSAATTNAAKAGIIVVAAAGNQGPNAYVSGSPASAEGAIAVAANDPTPSFPGALLRLANGTSIQAINANGAPLPSGALTVKVLRTATGAISFGCDPADYVDVAGKLVVTLRGPCARVTRAMNGQKAGAAAVVMVNTSNTFPPFEGPITFNPDTGELYTVTIPFFGVKSSTAAAWVAGNGLASTFTAIELANPTYTALADFSSGGPRTGDGHLKPDVTAPGVSIVSALVGSGNLAFGGSGTSQATPHTSGIAALTREAHPDWRAEDVKSAIVHTATPAGVAGYSPRLAGTGLVQAPASTATQVVARTSGGKFGAALNFGVAEFRNDYSRALDITLRNLGGTAATFNVARARASGSPHTLVLTSPSVTVPANGEALITATLNVPAATAGSSSASGLSFRDVAGLVEFTPQGTDNGGVTLRVPYYLVPRVAANVSTSIGKLAGTNPSTTANVTNKNGAIAGNADFYAWGLSAPESKDKLNQTNDVRAVGVQAFPFNASTQVLIFAINNYNPWSSPSSNEFVINIDVDGDGKADYEVVGFDFGNGTAGSINGRMGAFVVDLVSGSVSIDFFAVAPTDSSTILLPVLSSRLCRTGNACLSAANPRLSYSVVSFDLLNGGKKVIPGVAAFNAWSSSISNGGFVNVAPGASNSNVVVQVNSAEAARTPALGLMVVTFDNKSGADEAQLIPVSVK